MTKQPFMQFYPGDYLADTPHLTTEQHGAYLLILMAMWTNGGSLPNDDRRLARIARVSHRRWHLVRDEIFDLLVIEGDSVTQMRLKREHQKALSKSEKRSAAGKAGYAAKSLKTNKPDRPFARPLLKHSPEPEPDSNKIHPTDVCRKPRISYTKEFESFWKPFPTDPNMSKKEAFAQWKKLTPDDRQKAIESLSGFNAYCAERPDYRPVHACRYLSQRRFDGYVDSKTEELEELRRRLNA